MNIEARLLLEANRIEVETFPGGPAEFRRHALSNIRVKTVVKESHGKPISCLAFNQADGAKNSRLFATVGLDQATVYDDEHMGEHVSVISQFQNVATEHTKGGELCVCAWVNSDGWQPHPMGDAVLAVSGKDPSISIISVAESRVIHLLRGHLQEVIDLCGCPGRPGLLVSLSKDGAVKVWDVSSPDPLHSAEISGATSLCVAPDASSAVVGTRHGILHWLDLGGLGGWGGCKRKAEAFSSGPLEMSSAGPHEKAVDCVMFLSQGRLASKSIDGRMNVWDIDRQKAVASWRVPNCTLQEASERSRFAADPNGAFIAVGSSKGDLFVYDAETGKRLSHVEPMKVVAPVKACSVSADCRRVLAVLGNGFIFRYQYTKPEPEGRLDDGQEGKAGHRGEGDSGYAAREELNENRDCDAAMQPPPIVPREDVSVIHRDLSPE